MMAGFYCTLRSFTNLKIKSVCLAFFLPHLKCSNKEYSHNFNYITGSELWLSDFFCCGWLLNAGPFLWVPHTLSSWPGPPLPWLPTGPWSPSHPGLSTDWCLADPKGCISGHHGGENKAVFDGEVIQPFCVQLDLGYSGWLDVDCKIIHQPGAKEKKAKGSLVIDCLACTHPQ